MDVVKSFLRLTLWRSSGGVYRQLLTLDILFYFLLYLVPAIFCIVKTWDFDISNATRKDLSVCCSFDTHFISSPAILTG